MELDEGVEIFFSSIAVVIRDECSEKPEAPLQADQTILLDLGLATTRGRSARALIIGAR